MSDWPWLSAWSEEMDRRFDTLDPLLDRLVKWKGLPRPKAVATALAPLTPSEQTELLEAFAWMRMLERRRVIARRIEHKASKKPKPESVSEPKGHHKKSRRCDCESCVKWYIEEDERTDRYNALTIKVFKDFAKALRMEWTAELLASDFALGDGTFVTWGEATVEQHQQRIDMLSAQASGVIETAARHQKAVEALETSGATNLSEMVEGSAAA